MIRDFRFKFGAITLAIMFSMTARVVVGQDAGAPVPVAEAVGKTGVLSVTFSEHSPLSNPAVIAKRWITPPAQKEKVTIEYDMLQPRYMYVPAVPSNDGTYGLLVGASFNGHQFAPEKWKPVLEKYHLIWVGVAVEDQNLSPSQTAAMLLDAAYGVTSVWKIDPLRVYLQVSDGTKFQGGMPLYFPDVFSGSIYFNVGGWYRKLKSAQTNSVWDSDNWPQPAASSMQIARQRSRVFIGFQGTNDPANGTAGRAHRTETFNDVVIRQGFRQAGISLATDVMVDPALMQNYSDQDGAWFEQAVQYLDAPLAKLRPTTRPAHNH